MKRFPRRLRLRAFVLLCALLSAAYPAKAESTLQLNVPGPQTVPAGSTLRFTVSASGGDSPTVGMRSGPQGSTFTSQPFDASRGEFEWTPGIDVRGGYRATFYAQQGIEGGDGRTTVEASVEITVVPPDEPGDPPVLRVPPLVETIVGRPLSFRISATDPDGDAVTLSVQGTPVPGSMFTDGGSGVGHYEITPGRELAGTEHAIVFAAAGRRGEPVATTTTRLRIGQPEGENPPKVDAPERVEAPAGRATEVIVEAFDPDGGSVTPELVASGGLDAEIRPTSDAHHFALVLSPRRSHAGQAFNLEVAAMDSSGMRSTDAFTVTVPAASSGETVDLEVRWGSPDPEDPFAEPGEVEVFGSPGTISRINGDGLDVLGYAVYASTEETFEPSEETLVSLANPTWRNGLVTVTVPAGKRSHRPLHVRVTVRRTNGTSRPSKETSTDLPRFPSIPALLKGKLVLPAMGSNLLPGALLEVRIVPEQPGERFPFTLNRKGTKFIIKPGTMSTGGVRFSDVVRPGQAAVLILVNQNGKTSAPMTFAP